MSAASFGQLGGVPGQLAASEVAESIRRGRSFRGLGRSQKASRDAVATVIPDGRSCNLCRAKDDSPDPIVAVEFRKWGYAPENGKNVGNVCYYCMRVFTCRYKIKMTCKGLVQKCGVDEQEHATFMELLKLCIEKFKESGSRDMQLSLPAAPVLSERQSDQLIWEEPEEQYWEINDYKSDIKSTKLVRHRVEILDSAMNQKLCQFFVASSRKLKTCPTAL
jgi:hypothetical protein